MKTTVKILTLLFLQYIYATEVPKKLTYAGIELELSDKVRAEIQKYVDFIERNPLALRSMTERANVYFPIIEEAFTYVGVPKDLMYISIQESGLRGNAVSSSLAVGYWQLKDFTAKEVGLTINSLIDERRHIYRASVAASFYFYKQWLRYDNWLYSVIAYYEGGTGAEPYTQAKYIGAKKMHLKTLHWYAEKAIAHKLVYEKLLKYPSDEKWLQAKPLTPYSSLYTLLNKEQLDKNTFKKYNPWLLKERLPKDYQISFYILKENTSYAYNGEPFKNFNETLINKYKSRKLYTQKQTTEERLDNKIITEKEPKKIVIEKKVKKENPLPPKNISVFYIKKEPLYGEEFVVLNPGESIKAIAKKYGIKLKKLLRWNNLTEAEKIKSPKVIYLVKPKKAHIHIVGKYETIYDIALLHKKKVKKLIQLNRLKKENPVIFYGQKIYLKNQKPIDEKLIVYTFKKKPLIKYTLNTFNIKQEKENKEFIFHTVKKGETLWQISRKYNVNIQEIRDINGLRSNIIKEGTRLKIPKK